MFAAAFDDRQKEERDAISSRPILGPADTTSPVHPVEKAARTAAGLKRNIAFSAPKPRTVTAASLGIIHKHDAPKQENSASKETVSERLCDAKDRMEDGDIVNRTEQSGKVVAANGKSTVTTQSPQGETVKNKETIGEGTSGTSVNSSGLGSLFANYDSSSNSGTDD